jgi:hypothetical protein
LASRLLTAALVAVCAGCATGPDGALRRAEAEPDWSAQPDFDALRAEWGDREDYTERCEADRPLKELSAALEAQAWEAVLAVTDPWLARCRVDIDFHALRASALRELGRTAESEEQARWRDGLLASILRSGDGKTEETAWVVISVAEEYAVLHAFGLRRRSQALIAGRLDRIEAEREGRVVTLYFDPQAHFRRLQRKFGAP